MYQWIPEHVRTHDTEVADTIATSARISSQLSNVPLSRSYVCSVIFQMGRTINESLCSSEDYRTEALQQLDPGVKLGLPTTVSRKHQRQIHRRRLGVAFL